VAALVGRMCCTECEAGRFERTLRDARFCQAEIEATGDEQEIIGRSEHSNNIRQLRVQLWK
jgi:hypothetical protein